MQLLVFAHRGEAQEFIRHFSFRPKDGRQDLYQDKSGSRLLLITGEGIYEAMTAIGPVLGKYPVREVLNLGIAGSLSEDVKLGSFLKVRTVYLFEDEPRFQSFSLTEDLSGIDIISSKKRVLDDEYAKKLSPFAPLVDRELWGLAKVCKSAGQPLRARKLVSDYAGSQTACFDLKDKALDFSRQLLQEYLAMSANEEHPSTGGRLQTAAFQATEEDSPPLSMSFSQQARYRKLFKSLRLRPEFNADKLRELVLNLEGDAGLGRKQKAGALLEEMEDMLNPAKKAAKENFAKLTAPLTEIGAKALFDKHYEKKKFVLSMEINGQPNIENLKNALNYLRFESFEKIWEGKSDV